MNSFLDPENQGVEGAEELREVIAGIRRATYENIKEIFKLIIEANGGQNKLSLFKDKMYQDTKSIIDAATIEVLYSVYPEERQSWTHLHSMSTNSYYYSKIEEPVLKGFFQSSLETGREMKIIDVKRRYQSLVENLSKDLKISVQKALDLIGNNDDEKKRFVHSFLRDFHELQNKQFYVGKDHPYSDEYGFAGTNVLFDKLLEEIINSTRSQN